MVQLTDELVDLLDREATRRNVSRSALIREILQERLADEAEARVSEQIAEGYRRVPPATPDGWTDLGEFADTAARELLERLDAEERREGYPPW